MKKLFAVLIISICCTVTLFSQMEKGNFIISFDGNYNGYNHKRKTDDVNTAKYYSANLNPSFGYCFTKNLSAGVGIDIEWKRNDILMEELSLTPGFNSILYSMKTINYLPYIYFEYRYELFNRLYFNPKIKFRYGKSHNDNGDNNLKADMWGISIKPEISYFISKHFGLYLSIGEFGFTQASFDEKKEDSWITSISPTEWALGLRLSL